MTERAERRRDSTDRDQIINSSFPLSFLFFFFSSKCSGALIRTRFGLFFTFLFCFWGFLFSKICFFNLSSVRRRTKKCVSIVWILDFFTDFFFFFFFFRAWMCWRITVFSRNSNSSTTLVISLRCLPWRRTGSRSETMRFSRLFRETDGLRNWDACAGLLFSACACSVLHQRSAHERQRKPRVVASFFSLPTWSTARFADRRKHAHAWKTGAGGGNKHGALRTNS